MNGSAFVFDCLHLLSYKCYKINPNRGGSCIDSPDWIKNNKLFQCAVTVVLNHEECKRRSVNNNKDETF